MVFKDGREWCLDVLDKFVTAGQSVNVGEAVVRRYRPVTLDHNHIVLGIYSSDSDKAEVVPQISLMDVLLSQLCLFQFITDRGVEQCGSLSMNLDECKGERER